MANKKQLGILKQGVDVWNNWIWHEKDPEEKIDLVEADLSNMDLSKAFFPDKADLRGANLDDATLRQAYLRGADLQGASLWDASLFEADISHANLRKAKLWKACLIGANLSESNLSETDLEGGADLRNANLSRANLTKASLSHAILFQTDLSYANLNGANLSNVDLQSAILCEADLSGVNLHGANLKEANITNAKITKSNIYGVNVWDLKGEFREQKDLVITRSWEAAITVDNIKTAQFVYLILNNEEIRDVINTLTSKSVLILGRFTIPKRKAVLEALKNKLREYGLLPIVFDFDRSTDKDYTETIITLAGLSYFVIADVTSPKSTPLELQATVPLLQVPFVPIIQKGQRPFAMMADLQTKYNWVLPTRTYSSKEALIKGLEKGIIEPAMQKHNELRLVKAQKPDTVSLDNL